MVMGDWPQELMKKRSLLLQVLPGLEIHPYPYCLESSQDLARRLYKGSGITLVVCGEIVNARGRLGRVWSAPKGGLWFTLAFALKEVGRLGILSLGSGVAVAKAVSSVTGLKARVKWPNDVLVHGRKIAGILVEASEVEKVGYLVLLGVGVNVNNPLPVELQSRASSLREFLGFEVDLGRLLGETLRELQLVQVKIQGGGASEVLEEWKKLSETLGRQVAVILPGGKTVKGVAIDIEENGGLVVESEGSIQVFYAGDVEHLMHTDS